MDKVLVARLAVLQAAVVGRPDSRWGEVPGAFVTLREGAHVSEAELIGWVRERLARFKAPKPVYLSDLPKTSTGKIQKFELRKRIGPAEQP